MIQWNGHRVFGVLAMSRSIGMYFVMIDFTLFGFYRITNSNTNTSTLQM